MWLGIRQILITFYLAIFTMAPIVAAAQQRQNLTLGPPQFDNDPPLSATKSLAC